ncbi:MAG: hypothetical protein K2L00_08755 [Muribaculaceae bacterium]|nr:hypothetical protein [Muribaculaceae bacterium]
MEEERLKEIFSGYNPKLSSSMDFMERLELRLDAVEIVRKENESIIKRNRIAVVFASLAGFITGVISTLLFPYLHGLVNSVADIILSTCSIPTPIYGLQILTWLLIGGISVFVAVNTYSISTSLLPHH